MLTLKVLLLVSSVLATCSAFGFNFGGDKTTTAAPSTTAPATSRLVRERDGEPLYTFRYTVQDATTGDYKSQEERRDSGGQVRGTYSVAEPNGDLRVVSYSADKDSGFRAEVRVEPAGTITNSQSPEGRTFANFLTNPFNLFRGGNIFSKTPAPPSPPPQPQPAQYMRYYPQPAASNPQTVFAPIEKPVENQPAPAVEIRRPVYNDNRPMYPVNNRPIFVESGVNDFFRTRFSDVTPASTFQLPSDQYAEFTQHLPETPAIPITPSPVEQDNTQTRNRFMFRRPVPPMLATKPTVATTLNSRYSTGTFAPSTAFPLRYSPGVQQPIQRIQQNYYQPQVQPQVQPQAYPTMMPNQGYMLVRTYVVPMPPGARFPSNFYPVPFAPASMSPVVVPNSVPTDTPLKSTQVKTTSVPVPAETDAPITTVTTGSMQTTSS